MLVSFVIPDSFLIHSSDSLNQAHQLAQSGAYKDWTVGRKQPGAVRPETERGHSLAYL